MRFLLLAVFITALFTGAQAKANCFPQEIIDKSLTIQGLFPVSVMYNDHYWLILYVGGGLYYLVAISPDISCVVSRGRIRWYMGYRI